MIEYNEFYQLANVILQKLEKNSYFTNLITDELIKDGVVDQRKKGLIDDVFQWLVDKGFINRSGHLKNVWESTVEGRDVLRKGGIKEYIETLNEKKRKDEKKEKEEQRIRNLNIYNGERQKFTFVLAIVSAIITLILSYLKVAEIFEIWPYNL